MKKIVITLLLFSNILFAQNLQSYFNIIEKSDDLVYNFEFEPALDLLEQAIKKKSDRPEAYQILSKIYLWYYLGSKDPLDKKLFLDYSDSVVVRCQNILEDKPEDVKILYLLGNVYKYKAMLNAAISNSLDAFWATKKSVDYYEDVLDIDSTFYSAYGGIGIFEYALSFVPAFFNWALTITGLSADERNGFNFIKKAYHSGNIDKVEYQFQLAKLYDEHLAYYSKSEELLNDLVSKYPKNTLFKYQRAISYLKLKNLKLAEKDLKDVLDILHPKFAQTNSFSKFLLGDIYFRTGNYNKAIDFYQQFLNSSQTIDYTGIASLRLAICYHFVDKDLEFKRYALLAANGNEDLEDDDYAKEFGLNLLEHGFNRQREHQIKIENLFLSGKNSQVLKDVNNCIDSINLEEVKAVLLSYKTSVLIEQKKYNEAKNICNELTKYELRPSYWVKPMAYVNLAKISLAKGNYEAAKQYVMAASESKNYFRSNQVKSYLNKLKLSLNIK